MRPLSRTAAAAAASAFLFLSCEAPWQAGDRPCADTARLDLPVELADFAAAGSLWPFGAHGGNHPEGHPGIDFIIAGDADRGEIPVRASFAAEIISITPESDYPGSSCILLDSACVEVNLCHVRLDPALKAGESVARGQRLGTVGFIADEGRYSLHFGTYAGRDADPVCPADFLDADSVRCRMGLAAGGKAPAECGYAPGTATLMGRSEYEERFAREITVRCADGSGQSFALPAEDALCAPRLSASDRARMEACLGSACAGVW